MKKILISPDKFKGTLTATEAAQAIRSAALRLGCREVNMIPMADGGEGTLEALDNEITKSAVIATVDALMRPVECRYGVTADGTVIVEAARCIGLGLLSRDERNAMAATSFGLGLVLAGLIEQGHRKFIVALGGSATDDGGAGMAAALGARFFDATGAAIEVPAGESLARIARADLSALDAVKSVCSFTALCDVRNPLLGPNGATMVYAAQKGADRYACRRLEKGKCRLAVAVSTATGQNRTAIPFGGAAGGLGWGMTVFLDAEAVSGAEYVAASNGLEQAIADADLVISGEGRIDNQTDDGKTVDCVVRTAQRLGKPVILLCGTNASDRPDCYSVAERFGIRNAMQYPAASLERLAFEVLERYL